MDYKVYMSKKYGCAVAEFAGELNRETVPCYYQAIIDEVTKFGYCYRLINDLRKANINFTAEDMNKLSINLNNSVLKGWKRAVILQPDNENIVCFYKSLNLNLEVFYTLEDG